MTDFIQARNFTRVGQRTVTLIVLHTMEAAEKPGTARAVAQWFAGPVAPQASAHYCVDASEVVQCVQEHDVAWAAPGANRQGVHIELAGYARQTAADWDDDFSQRMLARAARLTADICHRHGIPADKLGTAELAAGKSGICGHVDVTRWQQSIGKAGSHTDPGAAFPWTRFLEVVEAHLFEAKLQEELAKP